jgi:predicted amidophosphoribosyltransferase
VSYTASRACPTCFDQLDADTNGCGYCAWKGEERRFNAAWYSPVRQSAHLGLCQIAAAVTMALLAELAWEATAQVDPYFSEEWSLVERCRALGVPI